MLRTDMGSENGIMAAIQCEVHQLATAHAYGPSTSNQRIEALWSHFKSAIDPWRTLFSALCETGEYSQGHHLQTAALRFAFMAMIQKSLNGFKQYWNTHCISATSLAPGGVPDVMFYGTHSECMAVTPASIQAAEPECEDAALSGDEEYDEYFTYVMEQQDLSFPCNQDDGIQLYETLYAAINR